ncbi:IpaB/EvcA family protein [uncultured Ligilactobacillus sp.]|uniref:IpaB/EvcA family protein n=1 Tax=uncultured Ligilactobacillus sp. TaxID=2837633 RepID=UPI00272B4CAD|nr:IpaB/EvcA family protein [uncultured Ligilactobacillus sp.]
MKKNELATRTKELIKKVEEKFPAGVEIEFKDPKKAGYLRHDQAQHYLHGGKLKIDVYDQTEPDYTIAHELLHFLLMFENTPQVAFNLTTGDSNRDHKFMVAGIDLYDTVLHTKVYAKQRKLGFIDDRIEELYLKGVLAILKPEPKGKRDEWMVLRTVTLLDALVFYADDLDYVLPKFKENYPLSLAAAQKLYALMTEKPLKTAFELRRGVVRLWKSFDKQLGDWNLLAMQLNDFITLTPVLSERQLRLETSALFEFYHTPWQENLTFKTAYVGRFKVDGQNTFILPDLGKEPAEGFKKLYAMPVKQLLEELGVEYLLR